MQKTTTDHTEIRTWTERKGGKPALLDHPTARADKIGIRIDFPGHDDEALLPERLLSQDISWEEFFTIFEEQKLAFVYDEEVESKDPTDWYHFAKR